jgi:hypothetical protein
MQEIRPPTVATPQDAANELANVSDLGVLAVGDGAVRYRELFEGRSTGAAGADTPSAGVGGARTPSANGATVGGTAVGGTAVGGTEVGGPGDMWPSPLALAELGMERIAGESFGSGNLPAPLYLRQADVRIGWDQFDGRVGGPVTLPPTEPRLAT